MDEFRAEHERMYGYAPDSPVQVVTFRVDAVASLPKPFGRVSKDSTSAASVKPSSAGSRRVFFPQSGGFVDTPVYLRADLPSGCSVGGPSIVKQTDTTTIILPGQTATTDEYGNMVLRFNEGAK